jgi:hypothetical protein
VHDIEWTGPQSIVPPRDWRTVVFGEAAPLERFTGARLVLSVSKSDSGPPTVHDGEVNRVARGAAGLSVQASFYRSVRITLLLPLEERDGRLTTQLDHAGCDPREVHRGIAFLDSIQSSSNVAAKLDDLRFVMRTDPHSSKIDEDLRGYADTAAEIDTLQDRTTTIFPMPPTVSVEDRAWTKALLIMLEGGIAPVPLWKVSGNSHPRTAVDNDNPLTALLTFKEFTIELFDREIAIRENVYLYHPNANITPTSEPDENGVTKFSVEGADDTVFLGYMPGRVHNTNKVTPWAIEGVPDLPYPALPPKELERP